VGQLIYIAHIKKVSSMTANAVMLTSHWEKWNSCLNSRFHTYRSKWTKILYAKLLKQDRVNHTSRKNHNALRSWSCYLVKGANTTSKWLLAWVVNYYHQQIFLRRILMCTQNRVDLWNLSLSLDASQQLTLLQMKHMD
jgi:hypothetical protein